MNRRIYSIVLAVLLLLCVFPQSALAAKSDEEDIKSVSLTVTSSVKEGEQGDLDVTSSGGRHCTVTSFDFENGKGEWKAGDVPKVKVELTADAGYYFSRSIGTGNVKVKGGTCTGVRRLDSGYSLEVTIRLKAVEGELGEVGDAYWLESPLGKAKWDEAENASAYELRLYRGSKLLKTVDKVTTNSYDFFSYMTKSGDYTFWVRAIPRDSGEKDYYDKGEWQVSENLYIKGSEVAKGSESADQAESPAKEADKGGGWTQDNSGWCYRRADGTTPGGAWELINGKWYLFDMRGYMLTGWQLRSDKYYYLTSNGDMVTGWLQYNRDWYYMGEDGSMRTGWITVDGMKYHLKGDGVMMTGWYKEGSDWYYLDPATGAAVTNTEIDGCYLNSEGVWNS